MYSASLDQDLVDTAGVQVTPVAPLMYGAVSTVYMPVSGQLKRTPGQSFGVAPPHDESS